MSAKFLGVDFFFKLIIYSVINRCTLKVTDYTLEKRDLFIIDPLISLLKPGASALLVNLLNPQSNFVDPTVLNSSLSIRCSAASFSRK